jgi:hypothetical protein
MSEPLKAVPSGRSTWTRRLIRWACAILAILAAVFLVAPGIYLLGISLLLDGFLNVTSGIRVGPPSPPTPLERANDARNAAELAGMSREAIAMIGIGAFIIATSLLARRYFARRPPSEACDAAKPSSGDRSLES